MTIGTNTEAVGCLEKAKGELRLIESTTESQVQSVAVVFREMAGSTDTILNLAGSIIACIENENVISILPKVQVLSTTARQFIGERLQAGSGSLETVEAESKLLHRLSQVTVQQSEIALKTKALSVLTNVEVAHLGDMGKGFQYLARELADFSRSLMEDAHALERHADSQKAAIEETRRALSIEIPHAREHLSLIEDELGKGLSALDFSLSQLSRTPVQFRACVEEIARQISGVVSAIQAHDITRQQLEHVLDALELISARIHNDGILEDETAQELPQAHAGLTIQIYQLKSIRVTVESWTSQIKTCITGILGVSASKIVGIGRVVLGQERDVSSQLARIELLERESQAYSARIRHTLDGLSSLMQFVSEHVQKSNSIRDRLRLLSFNSIIEASHLGTKADGVLAIAKTIKEISDEWSQITDRSARARDDVTTLVKQTSGTMKAFSGNSGERLREAQALAKGGLDNLRSAAAFAAKQSQEMENITDKMKAQNADVGNFDGALEACSGRIHTVLTFLETMRHELEIDRPDVKRRYDMTEIERLFSESYTTEMERDILHAALRGAAVPVTQPVLEGNSVELF